LWYNFANERRRTGCLICNQNAVTAWNVNRVHKRFTCRLRFNFKLFCVAFIYVNCLIFSLVLLFCERFTAIWPNVAACGIKVACILCVFKPYWSSLLYCSLLVLLVVFFPLKCLGALQRWWFSLKALDAVRVLESAVYGWQDWRRRI